MNNTIEDYEIEGFSLFSEQIDSYAKLLAEKKNLTLKQATKEIYDYLEKNQEQFEKENILDISKAVYLTLIRPFSTDKELEPINSPTPTSPGGNLIRKYLAYPVVSPEIPPKPSPKNILKATPPTPAYLTNNYKYRLFKKILFSLGIIIFNALLAALLFLTKPIKAISMLAPPKQFSIFFLSFSTFELLSYAFFRKKPLKNKCANIKDTQQKSLETISSLKVDFAQKPEKSSMIFDFEAKNTDTQLNNPLLISPPNTQRRKRSNRSLSIDTNLP
jgi:hypothetical protein